MSAYEALVRAAAAMLGGVGTIFGVAVIGWAMSLFERKQDAEKFNRRLGYLFVSSLISSSLWIAAALVLHMGGLS